MNLDLTLGRLAASMIEAVLESLSRPKIARVERRQLCRSLAGYRASGSVKETVFVSKYQVVLPTESEIAKALSLPIQKPVDHGEPH